MTASADMKPHFHHYYMDKEGVTDKWLLINTTLPMLSVLTLYLTFVLYLGPRAMKSRKAFELQGFMMIYNILQVAYNFWIIYMVLTSYDLITYIIKHICHPGDHNKTYNIRYLVLVSTWHYLCSKFIDLLDTIIMVLRKKQSHVTFLHVYHHVAMVVMTWYTIKYVIVHQCTPVVLLNSFVHVLMYSYYFLASLGPEVQKYLWWKRYLTRIQLAQFAVVIMYLVFLHLKGCEVAPSFTFLWIANVGIIMALFINFYVQNYSVKSK